jgi:hypothetical protein
VFLAWASGLVGSAEKLAGGAAGGGCEDEPCDHADAEGQDEQGGDQADSGQQCSHEDGKADGESGDEMNSGHRALDLPAKKERQTQEGGAARGLTRKHRVAVTPERRSPAGESGTGSSTTGATRSTLRRRRTRGPESARCSPMSLSRALNELVPDGRRFRVQPVEPDAAGGGPARA